MKIEGLAPIQHTNSVKSVESTQRQKDFSQFLKMREGGSAGSVDLPRSNSKEMVQDFAEWYFKQGKVYESSKSYEQAISAYEKANSVLPDINKSNTIDQVRKKAFGA
jgi:tetratricopeptide (TPR) repeat protein